jgi:Secretion system C-terminal sorting domain
MLEYILSESKLILFIEGGSMKTILKVLFLFFLFFNFVTFAQPLNNSFESWTNGDPTSWVTLDITGFVDCITQSSDAQNGSSSARLEVLDFLGTPFPPYLTSTDSNGNGHPVTQAYANFKGYYKFAPVGSDWLIVSVLMSVNDTMYVGGGAITIESATASWTEFNVPLVYFNGTTPNSTYITFTIGDTAGTIAANVGTVAYLDNLSFSGVASVQQLPGVVNNYKLEQNYPNPFNPSTNIQYSIPEASFVQLKVYDILGNEVATLVNQEQSAGIYKADFSGKGFASGLYIARLTAGNYVKDIKMTLLK